MDFRLFSSKIVHAKLVEAQLVHGGYPSTRTVARWTATGNAPPWVEQAMRELLCIEKEAAAPEWVKRLEDKVDSIGERVGVNQERIAVPVSTGGA